MKTFLALLSLVCVVASCTPEPTAQEILQNSIEAHGGQKVYNAHVAFNFRDKHYDGKYSEGRYELKRIFKDSLNNTITDVLTNDGFKRFANDSLVNLTEEWSGKYANSVNSVFYFFRLPFNLTDPAVILSYQGKGKIDGQTYYKLKVAFSQEGGGEDFTDKFIYWIHEDSYTLDYLAYEYATNGGGKRFRKAINQRKVNGWLINDYINYKPKDLGIDISNYDTYFAKDGFKKLSEIINEQVEVNY